jgi:hypothetical protein
MNNKIAGSILLSTSGLIATIGIIGSQISQALVKAGFYAGSNTGAVPPGPENASLHWVVIVSIIALAVLGAYFLFAPNKTE